ncbi:MAG TPA: precorrin-6y C5,15-methyltransferase (decarboxylating) subunit CbiE [Candidatus Brocadiia bacterium]|nr:precorrin-6y C5,15-methyltransferase (decarboxylating) subunit CbiE [Planctomycetota bacterium]MDO8093414.1 precorrin-6y C5,15-methyltransferase (decarboxylating) subunit CbiE [Candidatus Brocadiales bacterium]
MAKRITKKITIVGCGPGAINYITPAGLECIHNADVLIGSKRLLDTFPLIKSGAEKIKIEKNYRPLLNKIILLSRTKNVVILVSGDPGFYSYARLVIEKLGRANCNIIPGISSVQFAFASIGKSWHDAHFVTLHGRQKGIDGLIKAVKKHDTVAALIDKSISLKTLAHELLMAGITKRKIFVCENLSLPDERVREFNPVSLQSADADGLNVIIILNQSCHSERSEESRPYKR